MTEQNLGYVTVRLELDYWFLPETQEYTANIRLFIPMDEDKLIPRILRDEKITLIDDQLGSEWGYQIGSYRKGKVQLKDRNIDTLKSVANQYLADLRETLQMVAASNRNKILCLPTNTVYEDWTI